jgi:hypothetical protein
LACGLGYGLRGRNNAMNRPFWRMAIALTIAAGLVLAAHALGWSHLPITVE